MGLLNQVGICMSRLSVNEEEIDQRSFLIFFLERLSFFSDVMFWSGLQSTLIIFVEGQQGCVRYISL